MRVAKTSFLRDIETCLFFLHDHVVIDTLIKFVAQQGLQPPKHAKTVFTKNLLCVKQKIPVLL